MGNFASSLGTNQPFISVVPSTQIGQYAGLPMIFPILTDGAGDPATSTSLMSAVLRERSNITLNGVGIYTGGPNGQRFSVATEPLGVYRLWTIGASALLSHARTAVLREGLSVTMAADTNVVHATSGTPTGGSSGDYAVDYAGNAYYLNTSGTWAQVGTVYPAGGSAGVQTGPLATSATLAPNATAVENAIAAVLPSSATSGNVLTWNGTAWVAEAAAGGGGGGTAPTVETFADAIPLDGYKTSAPRTFTSADVLTPGALSEGGVYYVLAVGDGSSQPDYSAFALEPASSAYNSTAHRINRLLFTSYGNGALNTVLVTDMGTFLNAAPAFATGGAPVLAVAQSGQAASYTPGNVSGYPTPVITQQWQTSTDGGTTWVNVVTTPTYTPGSGDVGKKVRVIETATNVASSVSSTSNTVTIIAAATPLQWTSFTGNNVGATGSAPTFGVSVTSGINGTAAGANLCFAPNTPAYAILQLAAMNATSGDDNRAQFILDETDNTTTSIYAGASNHSYLACVADAAQAAYGYSNDDGSYGNCTVNWAVGDLIKVQTDGAATPTLSMSVSKDGGSTWTVLRARTGVANTKYYLKLFISAQDATTTVLSPSNVGMVASS